MWRSPNRAPTASTTSDSRNSWFACRWDVWMPTMPAHSGWSSGIAPLPISVGETGMSSVSASSTSSSAALATITPPPATMIGRSAPASSSSARSIAAGFGAGFAYSQLRVDLRVPLEVRALLDVDRQVDQHRAGAALAADPERLAERPRQLRGLLDLVGPLADGPGDLDDVDRLERLLVEHVGARLAGDADHRDRVGERRVEPGDHVRAGRAGRADRDPRLAGDPRVAVGGVRAALLVAHADVADGRAAERVVEREDRGAGDAERRPSRPRPRGL